nr:hypothetical protein [uncultured Brevundimonas sp.]
MALTLELPDLLAASDEAMQAMFPSFDGCWSRQTHQLLADHDTRLLSLNDNWAGTPQNWFCPVCNRYKVDLARKSGQGVLLCRLHWHHDHLRDCGEKILRRSVPVLDDPAARAVQFSAVAACKTSAERFHERLVCEDCNTADGRAKAMLKGVVHRDFSFAPSEIARFIVVAPNTPHDVVVEKARAIWDEVADDIDDRLAFMESLAARVTAGRHVREGSNYRPNETLALLADVMNAKSGSSSSIYSFQTAFSERSTRDDAAGTSTRPKTRRRVRIPTQEDLATFNATHPADSQWWAGGPDWTCAACGRSRFEMLRISNAGEWTASAHRRAVQTPEDRPEALHFRHGWYGAGPTYRGEEIVWICKDCRQVITDTKTAGEGLGDDCLTHDDLRAVLVDIRPHERPVHDRASAALRAAGNAFHVSGIRDLDAHRSRCWTEAERYRQLRHSGLSDSDARGWLVTEMDDHHLDASEYPALLDWRLGEAEAFAAAYALYRWPPKRQGG